jgi:ankyrin repeat protein
VEVTVSEQTPLHMALAQRPPALEAARMLLELGASRTARDNQGNTPNVGLLG